MVIRDDFIRRIGRFAGGGATRDFNYRSNLGGAGRIGTAVIIYSAADNEGRKKNGEKYPYIDFNTNYYWF